jgi:(1->4)-alpha-D-glucan 1-alpha-D-glucosylmutase
VAGTTGYDFMAFSAGLLIDRGSVVETTRTYERFIEGLVRFRQMRYDAKRQIARTAFAGEINVLASQLHAIAQRDRRRRDNTLGALRRAIETTLATFPIYRTYVVGGEAAPGDRAIIETALTEARRRDQTLIPDALDFLAEVLLLEGPEAGTALSPEEHERRLHFRRRFQQLSSPVMAKGFEDTTFYRYNRLVSLNEVGNDPSHFGVAPEAAHAWFAARARDWPGAMSASSTHDTKRSEDARARLHTLAEVPGLWAEEVRRWAQLNERHRTTVHGEPVPDRNTEYLIYQNLIASWPEDGAIDDTYRERLAGYLTKAMREMKVYTSWTAADEPVEGAVQGFLAALLHPRHGRAFQRRVTRFVARLEPSATLNALATLIVKATAPGFPDFYQGTELWDRSLTDPDNRRPVDYDARRALLGRLGDAPPGELRAGETKFWLTRRLLDLRGRHAALFAEGDYRPLEASGGAAANVFAFARGLGDECVVVAVPRLTTRLVGAGGEPPRGAAWDDTALVLPDGAGRWREAFTGAEYAGTEGHIACAEVFADLPFAILVRDGDAS